MDFATKNKHWLAPFLSEISAYRVIESDLLLISRRLITPKEITIPYGEWNVNIFIMYNRPTVGERNDVLCEIAYLERAGVR